MKANYGEEKQDLMTAGKESGGVRLCLSPSGPSLPGILMLTGKGTAPGLWQALSERAGHEREGELQREADSVSLQKLKASH